MVFRLYNVASGGSPLWEEQWSSANSIAVTDGLFNVMLGSLSPIPQGVITGNGSLWLGIAINTDAEMSPRVQLGSVPYAVQALTVPDGSITMAKLANGSITSQNVSLSHGTIVGTPAGKMDIDTNWLTIPGMNFVVSPTTAQVMQYIITVDGSKDSASSCLIAMLFVDGVAPAHARPAVLCGATQRNTASTTGEVFLSAGDHVVDVKAKSEGGTTNVIQVENSIITYWIFSQ